MADVVDPRTTPRDYIFIIAHDDQTPMAFHRRLVSERSPFLKAACKDSKDKNWPLVIKLPTAETSFQFKWITLTLYAEYIKTNRIRTEHICAENQPIPFDQYSCFFAMYLLGEYLEDSTFQDDVLDAILARYNDGEANSNAWVPTNGTIHFAYAHTPAGSPLRKFLVDVHVWAKAVGLKSERTHKVFLGELLSALVLRRTNGKVEDLFEAAAALVDIDRPSTQRVPRLRPRCAPQATQVSRKIPTGVSCCDYHKHEVGVICGNKKRKRELKEETERAAKRSSGRDREDSSSRVMRLVSISDD
ncbi:hypothetical protein M409DRAFT_20011 [Zasmidium cellare ATCC 36951]|uniref:BTB domain-containing protein n=1 Tax=Zasmidium cellare ATCC 36951 TaxID=1080233 RepID=A0A6A6CTT8_ZASCE|nr:uncharacterized protein M409DRAFT_20011 [Zasmidium cellare ATCC 36951]KAF2169598.1 hypothetical protein M409DRAFT_20011 [Zasmidium cellare ATCC 36951]